jgi:hypothetical protein
MSWVEESLAPKDLGALDSCDKHRNEGGECFDLQPLLKQLPLVMLGLVPSICRGW